MHYICVSEETLDFHDNCPDCKYLSIGGEEEGYVLQSFEEANTPPGHVLIQLTREEYDALHQPKYIVQRKGQEIELLEYNTITEEEWPGVRQEPAFKLDPDTTVAKIRDREKRDVPIEVEGMGGKEVVGFEEKPAAIVVERSSATERAT